MDIQYLVNRVSNTDVVKTVSIDGEDMQATVSMLEVELVDPSGRNGTQTLRFATQADKDAAAAKYVQGETITITV